MELEFCWINTIVNIFSDTGLHLTRVLLVKLKGHPFNMSLIQAYACQHSDSSEEVLERFYEILDAAKQQCKSQEIGHSYGLFECKGRRD